MFNEPQANWICRRGLPMYLDWLQRRGGVLEPQNVLHCGHLHKMIRRFLEDMFEQDHLCDGTGYGEREEQNSNYASRYVALAFSRYISIKVHWEKPFTGISHASLTHSRLLPGRLLMGRRVFAYPPPIGPASRPWYEALERDALPGVEVREYLEPDGSIDLRVGNDAGFSWVTRSTSDPPSGLLRHQWGWLFRISREGVLQLHERSIPETLFGSVE